MSTLSNKLKMAVSLAAAMCCLGALAHPRPSKSAQRMQGAAAIVESAGAAAVGVAAVIGAVKGTPAVVATPAPAVVVPPAPAVVAAPAVVRVPPVVPLPHGMSRSERRAVKMELTRRGIRTR